MKGGLGRGLDSLFGNFANEEQEDNIKTKNNNTLHEQNGIYHRKDSFPS